MEQRRDLISRADDFIRHNAPDGIWNEIAPKLMADFALSLNRWVEIKSEDDLPKEYGEYLWTFRYDDGEMEVRKRSFYDEGGRHFLATRPEYIAWRKPVEPFVPPAPPQEGE